MAVAPTGTYFSAGRWSDDPGGPGHRLLGPVADGLAGAGRRLVPLGSSLSTESSSREFGEAARYGTTSHDLLRYWGASAASRNRTAWLSLLRESGTSQVADVGPGAGHREPVGRPDGRGTGGPGVAVSGRPGEACEHDEGSAGSLPDHFAEPLTERRQVGVRDQAGALSA